MTYKITAPFVAMRENGYCFCLIWGIYVRFTKKMADYSQLIFSLILILEIAKCVFDGIQIGGHCWLMPTIRWKDPFNRRTDRWRLAGCWHTSLLTSQTSVCSAEKKSQIDFEIFRWSFLKFAASLWSSGASKTWNFLRFFLWQFSKHFSKHFLKIF